MFQVDTTFPGNHFIQFENLGFPCFKGHKKLIFETGHQSATEEMLAGSFPVPHPSTLPRMAGPLKDNMRGGLSHRVMSYGGYLHHHAEKTDPKGVSPVHT